MIDATTARRMIAALLLFGLGSVPAAAEPAQYEVDPDHFSIGFLVDHAGYGKVLGMFLEGSGSFTFDEDARTLSDVRIVIRTESVFTNHEKRDDHLRSPDFLNADEFPEMVFAAPGGTATGDRTGRIDGTLTLLGVSQPVSLDVTWNKSAEYPFGGGLFSDKPYVTGISARGRFKRSAFGMTYGIDGDLVGDDVELILELEAQRK